MVLFSFLKKPKENSKKSKVEIPKNIVLKDGSKGKRKDIIRVGGINLYTDVVITNNDIDFKTEVRGILIDAMLLDIHPDDITEYLYQRQLEMYKTAEKALVEYYFVDNIFVVIVNFKDKSGQ